MSSAATISVQVIYARFHTELGIFIESRELAEEFLRMTDFESSVYRLRLTPDGNDVEWVEGDPGRQTVFHVEPETGAWLRFKVWLLSPFVPESEL